MPYIVIHMRGFALPSILIASIVMLGVLAAALSSVATVRSGLNDQHYTTLAEEAAESGIQHMLACDKLLDGEWTGSSITLTPETDCSGAVIPEQQHTVYESSSQNSRYTTIIAIDSSGGQLSLKVTSTGTVNLLRKSNGAVWRTYSATQNAIHRVRTVLSIASSRTHACTLTNDRSVYCTGNNSHGQLGIGTTQHATKPITKFRLPSDTTALKVVTGEKQTCALASNNQLYCAGQNTVGQLGDGTTSHRSTPVRFAIPSNRVVTDAAIATNLFGPGDPDSDTSLPYTCARTTLSNGTDPQLYCAGANQHGQLGNGSTAVSVTTPVKFNLPSSQTVAKFAVGSSDFASSVDAHSHTCVINNLQQVYCAGRGAEGQIGNGSTANSATPARFGTITNIENVFILYRGTCVIRSDTSLLCAGQNRSGRFGNSMAAESTTPSPVAAFTGVSNISSIAPGPNQMCALTTAARVYCSGYATYGRLGNNNTATTLTPVQFIAAGASTALIDVQIGDIQTCVITTAARSVYCAGFNANGQLGTGTATIDQAGTTVAQGQFQLPAGAQAAQLATGIRSTCVLTTVGKGYCAGSNSYGQLGNDISSDQARPTRSLLINPAPIFY